MKKQSVYVIVLLVIAIIAFVGCKESKNEQANVSADEAHTPQYKWTFQSSDQPGEVAFKIEEAWAALVKQASGGRIEITIAAAGSIVEHNQTLDAVGSNIIQGDITDPSYFAGLDAAFALYGNMIGAWGKPEDMLRFMYFGGGFEVVNELLNTYGVELLGVSTVGTEAFVSKVPIRNIDDLKGIKLRAPEGLVQDLFKALGASPVNLPGSEVYTSLEKGVIDAADYSIFARNQAQGMNDVGKYPIYPGWHSTPAIQLTINKEVYDALPADLQGILRASAAYYSEFFLMKHQDIDRASVKEAYDKNTTIISWNPAEIQKVRETASKLWVKWAEKSPFAQKYYDTVIRYLKAQGMIR